MQRKNRFLLISILVVIFITIFWVFLGKFNISRADTIIIATPQTVFGNWEDKEKILRKDLKETDDLDKFNKNNSVYPNKISEKKQTQFLQQKNTSKVESDVIKNKIIIPASSPITTSTAPTSTVFSSSTSTTSSTPVESTNSTTTEENLSTSTPSNEFNEEEEEEEEINQQPNEQTTTTTNSSTQAGIFKKMLNWVASALRPNTIYATSTNISNSTQTSSPIFILPQSQPVTSSTIINTSTSQIINTTSPTNISTTIEVVSSSIEITSSTQITSSTSSTIINSTTSIGSTLPTNLPSVQILQPITNSDYIVDKNSIRYDKYWQRSLVIKDFQLKSQFNVIDESTLVEDPMLGISMANYAFEDAYLSISYQEGNGWKKLKTINFKKERSNKKNNGFFYVPLRHIKNINQLKNTQIKVTFHYVSDSKFNPIFIDAIWIESRNKERKEDQDIILASKRKDFGVDEDVALTFSYQKTNTTKIKMIRKAINKILTKQDNSGMEIASYLEDEQKRRINNFKPKVVYIDDDNFKITVDKKTQKLKPGVYTLKMDVYQDNKVTTYEQEFSWGLLTINSNKAKFFSNEWAYLQMAVLDNNGNTICDADLNLNVTSPNGKKDTLFPNYSENCGFNNVTQEPDYYANYKTAEVGIYNVNLINNDTGVEISYQFEVVNSVPFDIERIGPTRIYPPADYQMTVVINVLQNFKGTLTEKLPGNFDISAIKIRNPKTGKNVPTDLITILQNNVVSKISTNVDWTVGEKYELIYTFNAPNISPYLFLIGPLELKNDNNKKTIFNEFAQLPQSSQTIKTSSTPDIIITTSTDKIVKQTLEGKFKGTFNEGRQWQIASDALSYLDPNGDGTINCSPTPATSSHFATIDDAIRSPSAGGTGDYIICDNNQADFLDMTTFTNVSTTSNIEVFVYHLPGMDMDLEVELWDTAETTQYDTTQVLNFSVHSTKWESVNFGAILNQSQVDGLKVKLNYSTTSTPATSTIYSMYVAVTYEKVNQSPTVSNVSLNSGSNITLTDNNTTTVSMTATVSDPDGYTDIQTVIGTIYRSGVSGSENCSADNNDCYQVSSCELIDCSGNNCTATCSADIQFHADPTNTGSPWENEYWRGWIQAEDSISQTNSAYSPADNPDILTLTALSASTDQIVFGTFLPSTNDTNLPQITTISLTGNTSIDLNISGTELLNCNGTGEFPSYQTDDDTTNFNNGIHSDTQWDSTNNWLELTTAGQTAGTGIYNSRIIDSRHPNSRWTSLEWTSNRPTFKELPNNGAIETAYNNGNMDMTSNTILLHLNDNSLNDDSGNSNDATCSGTCPTTTNSGVFNEGIDFNGSSQYLELPTTTINSFINNSQPCTVSFWFKPDTVAAGSFIGYYDNAKYFQMGYSNADGAVLARIGQGSGGSLVTITSAGNYANSEWYHMAFTYDGASVSNLYINGTNVGSKTQVPSAFNSNKNIYLGALNHTAKGYSDIKLDEFAIFKNELSNTTIADMYKRGAHRVKIQLRSCDDGYCSVDPNFIGPDGTSATYFTELPNSSTNTPNFYITNLNNNRFFQYQATLETDNTSQSAEINSITANYCKVLPNSFIDDTQAEFNNGTYSDTQWNSINSQLELDSVGTSSGSGIYSSNIFDAGSSIQWLDLGWKPKFPYFKELPHNGKQESGYSSGNMNMSGNVLLFHLNDGEGATSFVDNSGYGNDGICYPDSNMCPANRSDQLHLNGHYYFYGYDSSTPHQIEIAHDDSLDFTSSYTLSTWLWLPSSKLFNVIFNRGAGQADDIEIYIRNGDMIVLHNRGNGGTFHYTSWPMPSITSKWIHVAIVWQNKTWEVYYDGVSQNRLTLYGTPSDPLDTNKKWLLGSSEHNALFGLNTPYLNGRLDEVAIFNRPLSASEIAGMYQRGAHNIKYQVRSCDDPACSGESFIGPDGGGTSYYSELFNFTNTPPLLDLSALSSNRYFQYQATLMNTNNSSTPFINSISPYYTGTSSTIPVSNVHYSFISSTPFASSSILAESPGTNEDVNIPKTTNTVSPQTKNIYWGLNTPNATFTGIFTGSINISGSVNTLPWP